MAPRKRIPATVDEALARELRGETVRQNHTQASIARAMNRSKAYMHARWKGTLPLTVPELVIWSDVLGKPAPDILAAALAHEAQLDAAELLDAPPPPTATSSKEPT